MEERGTKEEEKFKKYILRKGQGKVVGGGDDGPLGKFVKNCNRNKEKPRKGGKRKRHHHRGPDFHIKIEHGRLRHRKKRARGYKRRRVD